MNTLHHSRRAIAALTLGLLLAACGGGGNDDAAATPAASSDPAPTAPALTDGSAVAAGLRHTVFVKPDGTVWSLGDNPDGRLGDGTTTSRTAPVQASGLTQARFVSAGDATRWR